MSSLIPAFLLVLLDHSSVTLVLTITLSQLAHLSSSFIPGHLHISYLCVPMFVWRVSTFVCASMCVPVCRNLRWPAPLVCSLRKQRDECQCSACSLLSIQPRTLPRMVPITSRRCFLSSFDIFWK